MTATDGRVFEDEKPVRFHHCDPAGLIFYPQYFVLFHELMEDWFTRGLGEPYPDLIMRQRIGAPMGRVECDFLAPSRLGDILHFALRLSHLGKSSLTMAIDCSCGGEMRARAKLTVVIARLDEVRAHPITGELRAKMQRYLERSKD